MNTNYLIFGGILIVLILLTMSSSCVTPYHANSVYLKEYTYEGMEGESEEQEGMEDEDEVEGMEDEDEVEGMREGRRGHKKHRQGFTNIEGMEDEVEGMHEGRRGHKKHRHGFTNIEGMHEGRRGHKKHRQGFTNIEGMEEEEQEGMLEGRRGHKKHRQGFMNIEGMEEEEQEGMLEGRRGRGGGSKRHGFTNIEGMYHGKDGMYEGNRKRRQGFANIEGMEDEEEQEGFRGLGTSDYNNNMFILDQFSSAVGSAECAGKSSGLSNSKGPLCLSDDQKRLLQTRGGNASGMDSQIGGR